MKLLIVDDEIWSRRLIRNLLKWHDYGIHDIYEASGGKEAIELLEKHQCDLMITDMRMPGVDGAMLLEHIQTHHIAVEIIAMSGYEDYKYLHAALKTKAIDYLLKPVVKEQLEKAVLTGVNRINKEKSYTYLENILKKEDVKEQLNLYHDYRIKLVNAVHQASESEIINYSNKLYDQFFKNKMSPSFLSFILSDLKRLILSLEEEFDLTLHIYTDLIPEEIETNMLLLSKAITQKHQNNELSILNIQKYISNHINEAITLSSLAQIFYVTKEHLSRMFKKEVGTTVQKYITTKKIAYAKLLLRTHGAISISNIAYMCGYNDLQYFYRVFRKNTGTTPLKYRKQYQNNTITKSR
jgi:two-component system response regulator YesN